MDAPKCRTCEKRHWSTQPCGVTKSKSSVTKMGNNVTPVTKVNAITSTAAVDEALPTYQKTVAANPTLRGRPRIHDSNAERQKAYRGRHG